MKIKNPFIVLFILVLSITFLIIIEEINKGNIINETLTYLTSDECNGRLPGTIGSEKAQEYIINKLKTMKIEPYDSKYKIPFKFGNYSLYEDNAYLKIFDINNEIELELGKEYIPRNILNKSITLPLRMKPKKDEKCIFFSNAEISINDYSNNEMIIGVISEKDLLKRAKYSEFENKLYVDIKKGTSIKNLKNPNVSLYFPGEKKVINANNIVGVIKGKNRSKSIIISAHYDHLGSVNNVIYRGALDNATGVSSVLYIAEKLTQIYEFTQPEYDIIFCFFDGEEHSLRGSSEFSENIKDKYDYIVNLNIDCIGFENNDLITIGTVTRNGEKLYNLFKNRFDKANLETKIFKGLGSSDHSSFWDNNMASIWINNIYSTEEENISFIHTILDTKENIDTELIARICNCIVEIVQNDITYFEFTEDNIKIEDSRQSIIIEEERSKLKFGEFKTIRVNEKEHFIINNKIVIENGKSKTNLDNNNYQFDIIDKITKYCNKFNKSLIQISFSTLPLEKTVEDKIQKIDYCSADIERIYILFQLEDTKNCDSIDMKKVDLKDTAYNYIYESNIEKFNTGKFNDGTFTIYDTNFAIEEKVFNRYYLKLSDDKYLLRVGTIIQDEGSISFVYLNKYFEDINFKDFEEYLSNIKAIDFIEEIITCIE